MAAQSCMHDSQDFSNLVADLIAGITTLHSWVLAASVLTY